MRRSHRTRRLGAWPVYLLGLVAVGLTASPLRGPAGNREFLMLLRREGIPLEDARLDAVVDEEGRS